jgi:Domain of unknown function (DUF4282)
MRWQRAGFGNANPKQYVARRAFGAKLEQTKSRGRKHIVGGETMSDTAHVLEASRLTEGKGFFERLLDFSFQYFITQKYAKLLYGIHLLLGLIAGTWYVFNGFQASTSQGLLNVLLAVVAYFLWILYVRVALEFLVAMFRTAENIARASGRDS